MTAEGAAWLLGATTFCFCVYSVLTCLRASRLSSDLSASSATNLRLWSDLEDERQEAHRLRARVRTLEMANLRLGGAEVSANHGGA